MKTEAEGGLRPSYVVVAFAAALVLGATTVQMVFAADSQTINGCYNNKTGKLKVVDSPSQCKKNKQTPISWNKMGPPGPQGEPGTQGAQGPQGPEGQPPPFAFAKAVDPFSVDAPVDPTTNSYIQALDGPSITVDVPASGFIEVGASAYVSGDAAGAVQLFDISDNTPVLGQSDVCDDISDAPDGEGLLFTSPGGSFLEGTFSTPAVPNAIGFCANSGGPGTVLLGPLSPGSHDLELRYATCGCSSPPDEAIFSTRQLWARPAP